MIIEIEVGGAKQRVNVDDSFKDLTPEQQQQDVEHIAQSMSATKEKPQTKEKSIDAQLNDIVIPGAGAVAGTTVGGATTAGRIIGGLKDAAKGADPVAMEQARRIAEKNAVETWGRTQHRVPGMPTEKPGLYFGEPTYALEKQRAYNEIQKMAADPQYQAKVLAEQKPAVAQYTQRVARENPTAMQKVGRFLGKSPMGAIAGGLTGLGAGFQASDAVNRYNEGDKLGSAISGVGALGTGLAMIPHPITRVGGTAVGLGAEGLNAYIDFLKKNNPFNNPQLKQMLQPQQQQQPQQQMAKGGKVKPLSKAQKAMKHFADGGAVSSPINVGEPQMVSAFNQEMDFAKPEMMADMGQPMMVNTSAPMMADMGQPMMVNAPMMGSMGQPKMMAMANNPVQRQVGLLKPRGPSSLTPHPRPVAPPTALSRPQKSNYVAINKNIQPRAPRIAIPRRPARGGLA